MYTKKPNRWHTTCSPRPPKLSQCHMDLHVWSYPQHSYIFHVSSKSVQGFQNSRGSKFALSDYFGYWLSQQLVLPTSHYTVNYLQKFRVPHSKHIPFGGSISHMHEYSYLSVSINIRNLKCLTLVQGWLRYFRSQISDIFYIFDIYGFL